MSLCEDPFAVLGVRREASPDEVKRAYRRLVMKWHPDRNHSPPAGDEFRRVQAAYELLLDPQRLAEWQLMQAAATTAANAQGHARGGGEDLTQALTLTLEEAALGCRRKIELRHRFNCASCRGSGTVQHHLSVPCRVCSGCGRVARKGGGTKRCEICAGRGYVHETPCTDCAGTGWHEELRTLAVRVPPGLRDGERLRLARQAPLARDDSVAGDLYLVISLATHPLFVLHGNDLHCQLPVSVFRLLCGGRIEVPTLCGTASVDLPPQPPQPPEHRLPGLGFPYQRGTAAGDLVLHLQCIIPQATGSEDRALLEQLELRLAADLERRAPQLAAWELQMQQRGAHRQPDGG